MKNSAWWAYFAQKIPIRSTKIFVDRMIRYFDPLTLRLDSISTRKHFYPKTLRLGFIANEDFWPPPRPSPPPYRIDFAKIRKKSESTQNGIIRQEIEKKFFAPWWPPPEKNFLKVVHNHLKRRENWKSRKNFFFSYDQKKLRKIFKKKIFQKFFESCSESSETWKKLKKKFSLFSLYQSRT